MEFEERWKIWNLKKTKQKQQQQQQKTNAHPGNGTPVSTVGGYNDTTTPEAHFGRSV